MTLTETAIFFKRYSKWAVVAVLALIALWFLVGYAITTYQRLYPTKVMPTVRFGQLSKPSFTVNTTKNLSFVLDTIDGNLPNLPTVLPVYQYALLQPTLTDLDQAKAIAKGFGFTGVPVASSADTYVFTNPLIPQTFTINTLSKNFSLATTNFTDPTISQTAPPDATDDLITKARKILSNQGLLKDDLAKSNATVTYQKIVSNSLVNANSLSEANAARVDIFRDSLAGYAIVGPSKDQAPVFLVLAAASGNKQSLLQVGYTYWDYLVDGSSTYPLQSIDSAWNDLKAGKGTLIYPTKPSFTEVRIKNITIGYFDDVTSQSYLQPIYIFDGESVSDTNTVTDVRLYLPAIDPSYLK